MGPNIYCENDRTSDPRIGLGVARERKRWFCERLPLSVRAWAVILSALIAISLRSVPANAALIPQVYYSSSITSVSSNSQRYGNCFGKTDALGLQVTSAFNPKVPVRVGLFAETRKYFPSDFPKGTGITETNSGTAGGVVAILTKRFWGLVDPYLSVGFGGGSYTYRASGDAPRSDGSSEAPSYTTRFTSIGYLAAFGLGVMAKPQIKSFAGFNFGGESLRTSGTRGSMTSTAADGTVTEEEFDGKDRQTSGIVHFGFHIGLGFEF